MAHKAAISMFVYAVLLVDAGVFAYLIAPPEANAATALIVPAACALLMTLCGIASLMLRKNRAIGMIGIHAGLILPLVFAAAIGSRALAASGAAATYAEQSEAYERLPEADRPATFGAYLETLDEPGPDHDKTYLATTLWRLAGISGLAFVVILSQRPKPEARAASDEA